MVDVQSLSEEAGVSKLFHRDGTSLCVPSPAGDFIFTKMLLKNKDLASPVEVLLETVCMHHLLTRRAAEVS